MYRVKILSRRFVTHDVRRFTVERPEGYEFEPGQAVMTALDEDGWRDKERPFTFTGGTEDGVLEFVIKIYPEDEGVTERLDKAEAGEGLIMGEPFGSIGYRGPGVFLAGGAGITPFLAIFRNEEDVGESKLLFSNKRAEDIICEKELRYYFGDRAVFTLTREEREGYGYGRMDKRFLKERIKNISQHFYVCGPRPFVRDVNTNLKELGVESTSLVFEG